jgi:UDP-N-acetylmuramyl pentapeptide synthase
MNTIYIPITKEVQKKLKNSKRILKDKYNANFTYSQVIEKALDLLNDGEKKT